ncbi:MAG: ribosomal L7Ae/L30e/S12e/Gadd45 family protein [Firmicutes bacterium]|nr:ribosomal L7Ae/L30e/S12e/Gadd45 family protein [Bacillota bacterium]
MSEKKIFELLRRVGRERLVVGSNKVREGLQHRRFEMVVLGLDCETELVADMVRRCGDHKTKWVGVDSGKQLGECAGIDLRALCVGVKKE